MNWKILLFGCLLLPLLIGLGIWQLQRAAEKEETLASYSAQQKLPVEGWTALAKDSLRYQQVFLSGEYYSGADWLLDNQIHLGRFGYRIFTPFCQNNQCILVDRGWIKGDLNRENLPVVDTPYGNLVIAGRIDTLSLNSMIGEDEPQVTSPYRVQQIDTNNIRLQGKSLINQVLRLNNDEPGHYQVVWQPVVVGAEKHYGYAVQWFAMAFALVILLIFVGLKSRRPVASQEL